MGVWQGCPLSSIFFNIYLEDLMKNCFLNKGSVNKEGRRIKCIRFADDMALLAEDERIVKNMLMVPNDRCEDYGMKININNMKAMVIGRKLNKIDMLIKDKFVKQEDSYKYFGCNISSNLNCCQEVKQRIAMAKGTFNRKRSIFCGSFGKRTTEETSEVFCVECSVVWCRDLDTTME